MITIFRKKQDNIKKAVFAAGAVAAGFLNGMLGAGGGIVLVFVLSYICKGKDMEKEIFTMSLFGVFTLSILSSVFYTFHQGANTAVQPAATYIIIPAVAGGFFGGWLLYRLGNRLLRVIFSFVIIISGILMIIHV